MFTFSPSPKKSAAKTLDRADSFSNLRTDDDGTDWLGDDLDSATATSTKPPVAPGTLSNGTKRSTSRSALAVTRRRGSSVSLDSVPDGAGAGADASAAATDSDGLYLDKVSSYCPLFERGSVYVCP